MDLQEELNRMRDMMRIWSESKDDLPNTASFRDLKKTIDELNLYVKTGDVVWNQAKKDCIKKKIGDLVDSEKDGTLLIYNTNIVNCNLVLNNISSKEKKQYVKNIKKKPIEGKAILVNRGYGNVYHFNYVYVDLKAFYAENHVNMILPKTKEDEKNLLIVQNSFKDERTSKFIEYFVGNGSISQSEMEHVMPIFVS